MRSGKEHSPVRDVVLVGAGHAHVQVLKSFGARPMPGVRLTLVTKEQHTPYSGMLPGLIAGLYSFEDAHIDVKPLCDFAGARLYQTTCIGIDVAAKKVLCSDRLPVPYDILSLDTGSTPNIKGITGAREHTIPVKPVAEFLERLEALRWRVLNKPGVRHIAVVGGGAGSVELVLAVEQRLRRDLRNAGHDPSAFRLCLVTADARILPAFPERFSRRFVEILGDRGICIQGGSPVARVSETALHLADGRELAADEVFWTTDAAAPAWLKATGLELDENGFLYVDECLCAQGADNVFGAGDVIAFGPRPLPKSGVYAVRAGPVLAENIRRLISGRKLKRFKPQRQAMYLLSTGHRYAIGMRNGFIFAGQWVWHLKDWIDRRFMRRFKDLT